MLPGPMMMMSVRRGCVASQSCVLSPLPSSLLLPLPPSGARNGVLSTPSSAGLVFSLFFFRALSSFLSFPLFAPRLAASRDPVEVMGAGERWTGYLSSRIFTVEQSRSEKRTVRRGISRRAHPPKPFLISPGKRSANATQAFPSTLAVVSV